MKVVTSDQANLNELLEETVATHKPIQINSGKNHGILVAKKDWHAIQETLYLLTIPNMRETIQEGLKTPIEECSYE